MNELEKLIMKVNADWIRKGLTFVTGYLVARHVIKQPDADSFVSIVLQYVAESLPGVISYYLTKLKNKAAKVEVLTALMLPANTTQNELKEYIKDGMPTPTVKTPPDTAPGVPLDKP